MDIILLASLAISVTFCCMYYMFQDNNLANKFRSVSIASLCIFVFSFAMMIPSETTEKVIISNNLNVSHINNTITFDKPVKIICKTVKPRYSVELGKTEEYLIKTEY